LSVAQYLFPAFAFIFGAVVGSFLNVCIYRLPRHASVAFPPSHCPTCDYRIRWYDNIPIASYAALRGRCRSCGTHISFQYPVVELINAVLTLLLFLRFGQAIFYARGFVELLQAGFPFLVLFVFCSALVTITFIDLEHQIIPDVISLPGIVIGFVVSLLIPQLGWLNSLIGIIVGGGSLWLVAYGYELIAKKEGMGGGDIKLLAMMGAFLGWKAIPFIIFAASLIGSIVGVTVMVVRKKDSQYPIPFGPFLAGAAIVYIFFGRAIILWYLNLGR